MICITITDNNPRSSQVPPQVLQPTPASDPTETFTRIRCFHLSGESHHQLSGFIHRIVSGSTQFVRQFKLSSVFLIIKMGDSKNQHDIDGGVCLKAVNSTGTEHRGQPTVHIGTITLIQLMHQPDILHPVWTWHSIQATGIQTWARDQARGADGVSVCDLYIFICTHGWISC